MKLTAAAAIADFFTDFFESRVRRARIEYRNAKLRRELARLPSYIARDIGAGPDQDRFVNFLDD